MHSFSTGIRNSPAIINEDEETNTKRPPKKKTNEEEEEKAEKQEMEKKERNREESLSQEPEPAAKCPLSPLTQPQAKNVSRKKSVEGLV